VTAANCKWLLLSNVRGSGGGAENFFGLEQYGIGSSVTSQADCLPLHTLLEKLRDATIGEILGAAAVHLGELIRHSFMCLGKRLNQALRCLAYRHDVTFSVVRARFSPRNETERFGWVEMEAVWR